MVLRAGKLKIHISTLVPIFILSIYSEIVIPLLLSALLHELGHFTVIKIRDAKIHSLDISAGGLNITYQTAKLSYKEEILCTAAGPAASLVTSLVFSYLGEKFCIDYFYLISGASAALFLFNCIPISILDGGKIIFLFLTSRYGPFKAEKIILISDLTISSVFLILSLVFTALGVLNATMLLLAFVLIFSVVKSKDLV